MTEVVIRPETNLDRAAIDALLVASFPTPAEADLVHALRADEALSTSLVAEIDGAVVGYVAFSPVTVAGAVVRASGLAPVAVGHAHRGKGLAQALGRAGLALRRAAGDAFVVVLGEPRTYARLGFRPASTFGLSDDDGVGDAFQALELRAGGAPPGGGGVHYAAAFAGVGGEPQASGKPPFAMVLALGDNGALGLDGGLPWDLPDDRAHFERTTRGHAVVMGRRTWEESGQPLPGRLNLIVSRSAGAIAGATVVPSLEEALARARVLEMLPLVIGGRRLFEEALPQASRVYLTEVPGAPRADVFFRLDREGLREIASWPGARGERYVVLGPDVRAATAS